jgi:hypothetical protein
MPSCNCRRLWQQLPSCLKPIHCTITRTVTSISRKSCHLLIQYGNIYLPVKHSILSRWQACWWDYCECRHLSALHCSWTADSKARHISRSWNKMRLCFLCWQMSIDTLLTDRQLMLQEELEHRYLREFAGWGGNSFELVSFFQRRNPEVSALGRLHYDCYHHTGKSSYPCTEDNISTIIRLSGLTRHGNYLFHAVFVEST